MSASNRFYKDYHNLIKKFDALSITFIINILTHLSLKDITLGQNKHWKHCGGFTLGQNQKCMLNN